MVPCVVVGSALVDGSAPSDGGGSPLSGASSGGGGSPFSGASSGAGGWPLSGASSGAGGPGGASPLQVVCCLVADHHFHCLHCHLHDDVGHLQDHMPFFPEMQIQHH